MTQTAFERLVSEWLDQPRGNRLWRQILAAIAADPRLKVSLRQWCRLDDLIHRIFREPFPITAGQLRDRVAAALNARDASHGATSRDA